jgi:beta-glucanase (GH16 family)
MNNKKRFLLMFIISSLIVSCKKQTKQIEEIENTTGFSLIDKASPENAKPLINGSTTLDQWKLTFSDEFNDNQIDPFKWTVENSVRHRSDVSIYSNTNQVEEKNGNIYIYYSKASEINSKSYYAGRFNSKDKYSTLYGFLEAKIHLVKPNGYQTAFWLMPYSGQSMSNSNYHDGTAGDGSEIDIVEGNKLHSYSLGLHWDGYGDHHKGAGTTVSAKNMHDVEYHIFGLEWSKSFLKYYYDGRVVWQTSDPKAISHFAEYILFTGMCWGESDWVNGDVTKNTFIQNGGVDKAYIDYVRVYKYKQ